MAEDPGIGYKKKRLKVCGHDRAAHPRPAYG